MKFILLIIITLFFVFKMRKKTYYGIDKKIGRGVFCHNILLPGEVIEISPTLHIEKTADTELNKYLFNFKNNNMVGFGISSMFNHSDSPNVHWEYNDFGDIIFTSKKIILPGQQLYIDYGKKYWQNRTDKI